MIFADLQREFQTVLIGPQIYERVRDFTRGYLLRRDPLIYARGAHDYRDGLEDVLNDFVVDVLIQERQIDYVMTTASDLASFDALISRQLRRYIARTRVRSVIDNLIDRSVAVLREPPFRAEGRGSVERFHMNEADGDRSPTDAEISMAASLAQRIPKTLGQGEERAPKVYDAEGLKAVLAILMNAAFTVVVRADLQRFFENLLTPWAAALLELSDEVEPADHQLTPAEQAVVEETCQRMIASMTTEDRVIYQYKFANIPDRVVADAIGLSRQSTAPRKKALFDRMAAELGGLEAHVQEGVLIRLNGLIASTGTDTP